MVVFYMKYHNLFLNYLCCILNFLVYLEQICSLIVALLSTLWNRGVQKLGTNFHIDISNI